MTRGVGRRRWPRWAGVVAIGLVLATAVGLAISRREVRIVVSNRAAYTLTGVTLDYPGGTLRLGDLPSGTSVEASIWPGRPSGGRRAVVVRLVPGDGPPFEYRAELGPVSSWEVRDFRASSTGGGQFLFFQGPRSDPTRGLLRGLYRLLRLD